MRTPQHQHILDMAVIAALSTQPQVSARLILIAHEHGDLKLDLYGGIPAHRDDTYIVTDACLTGTTVSLFDILSQSQLNDFGAYCDRHLPSGAELVECARGEALALAHWEAGDCVELVAQMLD